MALLMKRIKIAMYLKLLYMVLFYLKADDTYYKQTFLLKLYNSYINNITCHTTNKNSDLFYKKIYYFYIQVRKVQEKGSTIIITKHRSHV